MTMVTTMGRTLLQHTTASDRRSHDYIVTTVGAEEGITCVPLLHNVMRG